MSKNTTIRNEKLFCLNCGGEQVIPYPIAIPIMTAIMEAFDKLHKDCPKTWQQPEVEQSKSKIEKIQFWLTQGEKGISSNTMMTVLGGEDGWGIHPNQFCHPHDPDDFRRCHLLLETVPEFRADLYKMKEVSQAWSNLVDNWDKLTEMLLEQMKTLKSYGMYEYMQELIQKGGEKF